MLSQLIVTKITTHIYKTRQALYIVCVSLHMYVCKRVFYAFGTHLDENTTHVYEDNKTSIPCMCVSMYVYVHVCVCMYVSMYVLTFVLQYGLYCAHHVWKRTVKLALLQLLQ